MSSTDADRVARRRRRLGPTRRRPRLPPLPLIPTAVGCRPPIARTACCQRFVAASTAQSDGDPRHGVEPRSPQPRKDDELHALLQTLITRLIKRLSRRGVLVDEVGLTYPDEPDAKADLAGTQRPRLAEAVPAGHSGHEALTLVARQEELRLRGFDGATAPSSPRPTPPARPLVGSSHRPLRFMLRSSRPRRPSPRDKFPQPGLQAPPDRRP